jgi:hypothetical protein
MSQEKVPLPILAVSASILLIITSLISLLLEDGGLPYIFPSLRGEAVEIYGGQGVYQFDTVYKAVMFQGYDWANLVVGVPLLVLGMVHYRRNQLKGQLLLAAVFSYLAYNYLIGVMGNAFNILFLMWTALFSIGIFGLAFILTKIDIDSFPENLTTHFPRRSLSVYLIILGAFLLFQYLSQIVSAYANGTPPPSLAVYTTLELAALELGLMIPLHFLSGLYLWQRKAVGYLAAILLTFTALMTFVSLTVSQLMLFLIHDVGGVFDVVLMAILALITLGFSAAIFRCIKDGATSLVPASPQRFGQSTAPLLLEEGYENGTNNK